MNVIEFVVENVICKDRNKSTRESCFTGIYKIRLRFAVDDGKYKHFQSFALR